MTRWHYERRMNVHKFCLTEPECAKIQGSQAIIETLGYFPAMENTILEDIDIQYTHRIGQRYQVSLLFDLTQGGKYSVKGDKKRIRITFYGVRDVHMHAFSMNWDSCAEIKFVNCMWEDISEVRQDHLPSDAPVIPQPFTGFVIGRGRDFYLEFDDTECTVDAYFED